MNTYRRSPSFPILPLFAVHLPPLPLPSTASLHDSPLLDPPHGLSSLPRHIAQVSPGTMKVSLLVSDWPFCDPATAPTRNGQDTPSTVCAGASSVLETGAFLDAKLVVRGPSSSTPVLFPQRSNGGGDIEAAGLEYGLSGESAQATLVMSEWVKTDDNGWSKVSERRGRCNYQHSVRTCTHLPCG